MRKNKIDGNRKDICLICAKKRKIHNRKAGQYCRECLGKSQVDFKGGVYG